jgi:hypothetical protein
LRQSALLQSSCTTSPRLSKEDTAYFELEISAEIDRQQTLLDPKVFCAAFPASSSFPGIGRNAALNNISATICNGTLTAITRWLCVNETKESH